MKAIFFEPETSEALELLGDAKRVVEFREEYHELIQYLNIAPLKANGRADLN